MKGSSGMSAEHPDLDLDELSRWKNDPRYLLVQRILESADFVRSPQLSKFLLYICTATLDGRAQTLSEQHVGVEVFGREADYDSAADTIVRSHALRLRRRLEQFFQRAGDSEPLHLIIPRGGYVPVFLPSPKHASAAKTDSWAGEDDETDRLVSTNPYDGDSGSSKSISRTAGATPLSGAYQIEEPSIELASASSATRSAGVTVEMVSTPKDAVLWRYRIASAFLICLCIGLIATIVLHLRSHFPTKRHHPLWGLLFTDDQPTHIVLGDSGLVLFHAVARQRVSLHDYLNDDVSQQMPSVQHVEPAFAKFLLHRRYTSMVDADALTHLLRLPEAIPERTLVQYARDMHLNDFKNGNVIIFGAQEAVPWVELFESHMDFVFSIDNPDTHACFLNRHPAARELGEYSSYTPETKTRVYAVLAFLPNLSASGNVLIVEGLSMAGTEAAVDLAMDDDRLLPILEKIRKPNGVLPHFELLLESDALGDSAGPARVVAIHLHD